LAIASKLAEDQIIAAPALFLGKQKGGCLFLRGLLLYEDECQAIH
jgi:hypothetical protein